jgi:hypothetical protein
MKNTIILTILFATLIITCFSQNTPQVEVLERKKAEYLKKIESYRDSVKILDLEIIKIELAKSDTFKKDSTYIIFLEPWAIVRESPIQGSKPIDTLESVAKGFRMFDYKDGYAKIIIGENSIGWVSHVWITNLNAPNVKAGISHFIQVEAGITVQPNNLNASTPKPQTSNTSQNKTVTCDSKQCSGLTKKGSRCRNITTNCNGRCYLH